MTGLTELPAVNGTRFSEIRYVEETGSTNADLLTRAAEGAAEGSVLLTGHQNAGRGRQRRSWHDEPGNALLVSVLIRPELSVAPLMPLVAGVAAVEAVTAMAPGEPPFAGLKWPNDVLAPRHDERKLAGILAESSIGADNRIAVVVGMGLNLRWATPPPPEIDARAATVSELCGRDVGGDTDRDQVLGLYLRAFEQHLAGIESNGTTGLLDQYRRYCLTLGRKVRFQTGAGDHVGTAVGVTDGGLLTLDTTENGLVELHAGDAHHLPL